MVTKETGFYKGPFVGGCGRQFDTIGSYGQTSTYGMSNTSPFCQHWSYYLLENLIGHVCNESESPTGSHARSNTQAGQ